MKNVVIAVLVIALAVAGYVLFSEKTEAPVTTDQFGQESGDGFVLAASFACTDGTNFIAEFPTSDRVEIIVAGEVVRNVPLVSETEGQRYEDGSYVYVFAGEEVTVTTKATGATTTCSQPVDPNNAPVNFGDRGEGGSVKQDVVVIVSESIVGTYESIDDAKFRREFKDDGTVVDSYEGKVVSTGTWKVYTKDAPLTVSFPLDGDAVYVQLRMSGSQEETLNFKIAKLTPEGLELVYMERGGNLRFTLVK